MKKKWFEPVKSNYKMALFHNNNKLTFSNKYMVVNMKMNKHDSSIFLD